MAKNKKKAGEKLVFVIIILIFAFSSVLAYSSLSIKAPPIQNNNSEENQQKAKTAEELATKGLKLDQNLTGVIHKLDPGTYSEGTHYIEAAGITLAILEASDSSINLDKYVDENVTVWGDTRMITGGDGAIMSVKKVEVSQ